MIIATKKENKTQAINIQQNLPYSCVTVAYQPTKGTWRGFVMPYGITYEAPTKEKIFSVLREMVDLHEDALREYNHPEHLTKVPLDDKQDIEKYNKISMELMNNLLAKNSKIHGADYYAEAKLPA